MFTVITGSPLKTTRIENADIRFEYYPAPGEIISISGFLKNFRNPIEVVYIATSGANKLRYSNLQSAKDIGLEVDFRKSLNFISGESEIWKNLFLSGNFTLIDASIEFDPLTAVDEEGNPVPAKRNRPLAGQSPYILNGGVLFAGKQLGLNVTYNHFGKRIAFASPGREEDQYEKPRDMLDLQLSYKFLKQQKAELRLNVSNMLNQDQIFYTNQFSSGNSKGVEAGWPSVERYPGADNLLPSDQLDPKGTSYNKDYDTVVRRNRFGGTYNLNFIYRF